MPTGIFPRTEQHRKRISRSLLGKKWSEERRKKYSGENSHAWRGNKVGYSSLHYWVRKVLGKAIRCVNKHIAKRYVWANISGKYRRDISDWQSLCQSCNLSDGIKVSKKFNGKI